MEFDQLEKERNTWIDEAIAACRRMLKQTKDKVMIKTLNDRIDEYQKQKSIDIVGPDEDDSETDSR